MNNVIKVIAAIAMIIDHIGLMFYPEIEAFRVIGRISMPIFAYCIAEGYIHTRNIKKYIIRMSVFAVIAQIPYSLIFGTRLNILFSFALSLLLLKLKDKYGKWIYLLVIPAALLNVEYGIYSVILILIFNEFKDKKSVMITAFVTATIMYSLTQQTVIQIAAIMAIYIILHLKGKRLKIPKYAFYLFYPAQWFVLLAISVILSRS
jgi:hypothetical protein